MIQAIDILFSASIPLIARHTETSPNLTASEQHGVKKKSLEELL